ncbi:MAG: hypothetical protein ACRC5Q_04880 [Culicoidibacterales bacterium]
MNFKKKLLIALCLTTISPLVTFASETHGYVQKEVPILTESYSNSITGNEKLDSLTAELDELSLLYENTTERLKLLAIESELTAKKAEIQTFYESNPEITQQLFPKETSNSSIYSGKYYPVADDLATPNWSLFGDILVTNAKDSTSSLYVGHAAIADIDTNWYVESCPKTKCNGAPREGVQYRQDYNQVWKSKPNSSWGRFLVRNASTQNYMNALGYAQSMVGMPYNWKFSSLGGGFYCSELVAFAWATGGGVKVISGLDYEAILPIELVWSANTYRVDGGL